MATSKIHQICASTRFHTTCLATFNPRAEVLPTKMLLSGMVIVHEVLVYLQENQKRRLINVELSLLIWKRARRCYPRAGRKNVMPGGFETSRFTTLTLYQRSVHRCFRTQQCMELSSWRSINVQDARASLGNPPRSSFLQVLIPDSTKTS